MRKCEDMNLGEGKGEGEERWWKKEKVWGYRNKMIEVWRRGRGVKKEEEEKG